MTWARYELEFDYNFYGIKCMQFFFFSLKRFQNIRGQSFLDQFEKFFKRPRRQIRMTLVQN